MKCEKRIMKWRRDGRYRDRGKKKTNKTGVFTTPVPFPRISSFYTDCYYVHQWGIRVSYTCTGDDKLRDASRKLASTGSDITQNSYSDVLRKY